jgi:hypothetical protein
MRITMTVEYHPELEGEFEPYIARVLEYPELQGYGSTSEAAKQDALAFLAEHLGHETKVLREEAAVELAEPQPAGTS